MSIVHSSLNHPLRVPLAAEVHSRPSLRLTAPETLTHLAVFAHADADQHVDNSALQHQTLLALCLHFGVAGPSAEAKYFFHDFGRFRLQWECHTEFATYTFAESQPQDWPLEEAFQHVPLRHVPESWLTSLQGTTMVAAHLVLNTATSFGAIPLPTLRGIFDGNVLVGTNALQAAEIWTDFAIQSDGFCRFVVLDVCLSYQQAGRLVQRVLEIETYRMMALMGLPHAQRATPILNGIEGELAKLTVAMTANDATEGGTLVADDEQALLHKIIDLAARMEKLSLENSYRFSASTAYFKLVQTRIDDLRESRIDGAPTIAEFMDRRLAPAMSTCTSIARRQHALGDRIAHTNDLLRTKVGIVQERQNRKILESLNTRAAHQLRLQQSVEGLSVVAISYYSIGLLSYLGKAMKAAGAPINPDVLTGVLIPVVAFAVWMGLRRLHKRMSKRAHA
ncbi:MAG: DUF3422 domain-containing protein [Pseudomonadota bacterium]